MVINTHRRPRLEGDFVNINLAYIRLASCNGRLFEEQFHENTKDKIVPSLLKLV